MTNPSFEFTRAYPQTGQIGDQRVACGKITATPDFEQIACKTMRLTFGQKTLRETGAQIYRAAPPWKDFPRSVFAEDDALVPQGLWILMRPGARRVWARSR